MEALQTVFETIKAVLEMIKKFFEDILGVVKPEEEGEGEEVEA